MPKLYSSEEIIRTLLRNGLNLFLKEEVIKSLGKQACQLLTVIILAERKQIPLGTFKSILRQSGLKATSFIK